MPIIRPMKDKHKGETALIMGGGTSLPHDLRQVDHFDRLIGVNQHSLILPLDYLCFLDRHMWPLVKDFRDVMMVTKLNKYYSEPNVIHADVGPSIGYSGAFAIWVADWFGFDRIDVCGMDQYNKRKDQRDYWWQGPQVLQAHKRGEGKSDMERLKDFIDQLQYSERVFFVSGRLKELHQ